MRVSGVTIKGVVMDASFLLTDRKILKVIT